MLPRLSELPRIAILGGGLAGLALGCYAKKNGLPFTVYEARRDIGGNCVTFRHGGFCFDSGAHRFHDKDAEITEDVRSLLGQDLKRIHVPSQIYYDGGLMEFPFHSLNLLKSIGFRDFSKAVFEALAARLKGGGEYRNFEDFALRTYGETLSERFLLNYTRKLWGIPCCQLSAHVAGERLNGLNLGGFVRQTVFGERAAPHHVEGPFWYPTTGIGVISEKSAALCGHENIRKEAKITRVLHRSERIRGLEINGTEQVNAEEVISTLPLNVLLQIMRPPPPQEILSAARGLRFRHLRLVALCLNVKSVTEAATVYFPEPEFPFTRISEPANRSVHMSPQGKTSLVAEVPCNAKDEVWNLEKDELVKLVSRPLVKIGWIREEEIMDAWVGQVYDAYPVMETGYEEKVRRIDHFLRGFGNLKTTGRNGRFAYLSIHNILRAAKEIIKEYCLQQREVGK